jgi:predicted transcriptional regulator
MNMPKGKQTPPEVIYKVMTSWATTNNYSETARALNMAESTVRKIVSDNKDKEEFARLCDEKKKDFADKATEIIDKGLELINRRLSVALDKQDELDRLIYEIESSDEEEISYKQKMSAISLIQEAQIQKIKDISTMIGTLYDKRALAKGESTNNTKVLIQLPEGVDEYAE